MGLRGEAFAHITFDNGNSSSQWVNIRKPAFAPVPSLSFEDLLAAPQLAFDASKIKGATTTTLSVLNVFLKDDFRAGLELLKDSHPNAYKALREASQVDDPAYLKKRLKTAQKKVAKATEGGESRADG